MPVEPSSPSAFVHQEGRNCWKVERADRVKLIIDAKQHFTDLKTALLAAERQILLIGWDFDTRVSLDGPHGSESLGKFITRLVRRNRSLNIYILKWNFGALKILGRGAMIFTFLKWMSHPRIKVKFDSAHPLGASHHQKLIVIDGRLAFCGGIDVTSGRWDDRNHDDSDTGRCDPDGNCYDPWHDISLALDGPAAAALAELARDRWKRASGKTIPAVEADGPWPFEDPVTATKADVAIARTRGEYRDSPAIRENEALFLDLIAGARRYIYAENQYFASRVIAAAIARRLSEPDPPEIVLVMPQTADGWLEQVAMDTARAQLVALLRKIDVDGKFRIYHPFAANGTAIYVHAKLTIVDDVVLRVGSSNMNNRSLGFDSECDLLVDSRAAGGDDLSATIRSIRTSLIAEHLGRPESLVGKMLGEGSMIETIESLRDDGRSLRPYLLEETGDLADFVAKENLLDPVGDEVSAAEKIGRAERWWNRKRRARS